MQEADGLTGALIVHPKEPVLEYDEDVIVFLQDFYLQSSVAQNYAVSRSTYYSLLYRFAQILTILFTPQLVSSPFVWIGNGNSILIGKSHISFNIPL